MDMFIEVKQIDKVKISNRCQTENSGIRESYPNHFWLLGNTVWYDAVNEVVGCKANKACLGFVKRKKSEHL